MGSPCCHYTQYNSRQLVQFWFSVSCQSANLILKDFGDEEGDSQGGGGGDGKPVRERDQGVERETNHKPEMMESEGNSLTLSLLYSGPGESEDDTVEHAGVDGVLQDLLVELLYQVPPGHQH